VIGGSATATQALREEHAVILRALVLLEVAAARLDAGPPAADSWWTELIEWLRSFADQHHHGKEELCLFPALTQAGVPAAGGPVGVMVAEHAEGRALLRAITESRGEERAEAARAYVRLLRDHIDKENGVLFPLADAILDSQDQQQLARALDKVRAVHGLVASRERAEAEIDRLAAALESG